MYPDYITNEVITQLVLSDPDPRSSFKNKDVGENVLRIQKPFLDCEVIMLLEEYTELCKTFQNLKKLATINVDLLYCCMDVKGVPEIQEEVNKVQELIHALINGKQVCDIEIFCLERDVRTEDDEGLGISQSALDEEENLKTQEYDNECNDDDHQDDKAGLQFDDSNECTERLSSNTSKSEKIQKSRRRIRTNPKLRTCPLCNKTFLGESGLRIHAHDEHGDVYKCTICSKVFERYKPFHDHQRCHIFGTQLCYICGEQLNSKQSLRSHLKNHEKYGIRRKSHLKRVCPVCGKSVSRVSLNRHIKSHSHSGAYKCSFCHKTFSHDRLRNLHQRTHSEFYPHRCAYCNTGFQAPELLRVHEKRHLADAHSASHDTSEGQGCKSKKRPKKKSISDRKPFKCRACTKEYSSGISLALHVLSWHSQELDHCFICNDDQIFNSFLDFESHLKSVHLSMKHFKCTTCGESFLTNHKLKLHRLLHNDKEVFNCEDCKKTFRTTEGLSHHRINKHSTEPSLYTCDVCGKRLSNSNNLARHCRIHSGEKPYKCLVCGSAFSSRDTHRTHLWTHTNEKRHRCDFCTRGFNDKRNYLSHLKTCSHRDAVEIKSETNMEIM